jgi:hypothetical protein
MLIKKLLKIFLSCFLLSSCVEHPKLPKRPDGLLCTHFSGMFFCNEINNPGVEKEYTKDSPEIQKAICLPLESFERYQAYVEELKVLAEKDCKLQ